MQASIIHTIKAPCGHPNGLDWYENTLWVDCSGSVFRINPENGDILYSVKAPSHAGVTHDGEHLWVLDFSPPAIYKINSETGDTLGTLTPIGPNPIGLAWDGKYIWAGEHHHGIYKIDPSKNQILTRFPCPGERTHDLAWDGESIWFVDTNLRMFYRMNVTNGEILASFPSPDNIEPHGLTWDGEKLWCTEGQDFIHRLDIKS